MTLHRNRITRIRQPASLCHDEHGRPYLSGRRDVYVVQDHLYRDLKPQCHFASESEAAPFALEGAQAQLTRLGTRPIGGETNPTGGPSVDE